MVVNGKILRQRKVKGELKGRQKKIFGLKMSEGRFYVRGKGPRTKEVVGGIGQ